MLQTTKNPIRLARTSALPFGASYTWFNNDRDLRFWRLLRELAAKTTKGRLLNQTGQLSALQIVQELHEPHFSSQAKRRSSPLRLCGHAPWAIPTFFHRRGYK
jgi:hypothetical protein